MDDASANPDAPTSDVAPALAKLHPDLAPLPQIDADDIAATRAQWKNRRIITYISLITLLVITAVCLSVAIILPGGANSISEISGIITTLILTFGSIVGGYIGFSTWESLSAGAGSMTRYRSYDRVER